MKRLESKTTPTMTLVEAQCLPYWPSWVLCNKKKAFENENANPTTMAQVEAQCLPFWPSMGLKMKSNKGKS
jgi:hypothetical protein